MRRSHGLAAAALLSATLLAVGMPSASAEPIGGPLLTGSDVIVDPGPTADPLPDVPVTAWVLADLESGAILAAKAPHIQRPPASVLKTLTLLTLTQQLDPALVYTTTYDDVAVEGSRVGLVEEATYTAQELFLCLMMQSGNDCASALASANGGLELSVAQMNEEAQRLQAYDTVAVNTTGVKLDPQVLLTRLSRIDKGVVPQQASYVVAFVDSGDNVLHWMVMGWQKDFTGWMVDYGAWPPQERAMFWKSDLTQTIGERYPGVSPEEAFVMAHNDLETFLLRDWPTTNHGTTKAVDLLLKDWGDGGHKPRIESQVLASADKNRIRPSRGRTVKPGRKPVHLWGDDKKDRHNGLDWIEIRTDQPMHVMFDANKWKANAAKRLLTTVGAPGAVLLPGSDERANRMLVEHLTSERPKSIRYDGAEGVVFELLPGREQDLLDCYVGCCVAGSMLGCGIAGEKPVVRQQERRTFVLPGGARR